MGYSDGCAENANRCFVFVESVVERARREQQNFGLRIANFELNEFAPPRQLNR